MDKKSKNLIFLALWSMILLGLVVFIAFEALCEKKEGEIVAQQSAITRLDTVVAIGVNEGICSGGYQSYTEIIFSNDLHLYYRESNYLRNTEPAPMNIHNDYNHPVYVMPGDICVVQIDEYNGEDNVTLVENLTNVNVDKNAEQLIKNAKQQMLSGL